MFEQIQVVYDYLLTYGRIQAHDIPDDQFTVQPAPGINHPAWQFGHLSVATDLALNLLGKPSLCPKEWGPLFNPGTKPVADASIYPSKKALVTAWKTGHEAVTAALPSASPADLEQPHGLPFELIQKAFPRKRDLLAHLLSTHEAGHLGQLALWRRLMGMKIIF